MDYLTVPLNSGHDKTKFSCGQALLDNYLHHQAKQDVKRHLSACFVMAGENNQVKGYYTLSSAGIERELIPDAIKSKLPVSYVHLPVILLGRLARDKNQNGKRLGEQLLLDALKRCYDTSLTIGSLAVIVDPIDAAAKQFYFKYGFIDLPDTGKMFLSMKTIADLFK